LDVASPEEVSVPAVITFRHPDSPMPLLPEGKLPESFPPFALFREHAGCIPSFLRVESRLPRVAEAHASLTRAILYAPGALERSRKEEILLATAAAREDAALAAWHQGSLEFLGVEPTRVQAVLSATGLSADASALFAFARALSIEPASIGPEDCQTLRERGLSDEQILEAILTVGLGEFLSVLVAGLGAAPESLPAALPGVPARDPERRRPNPPARETEPRLRAPVRSPEDFPPFALLRDGLGFVPRVFQAQTLHAEALDAEIGALREIFLTGDFLSRRQKALLALAVSAAQRHAYGVTLHAAVLRTLGVAADLCDRVVEDPASAGLPGQDLALVGTSRRLAARPREFGPEDVETLRRNGFRDEQILEAVAATALTAFLNVVQSGLGARPDFRVRHDFRAQAENLNPPGSAARPTIHDEGAPGRAPDPDAAEVARVREGDMSAFETLVRRHQGRVYRTLAGLTGSGDEAEDGTQAVFVKVFGKIGDFEGGSLFSTWLTRIAINEGLERLRSRRPMDRLDERDEADFRPARLQPWMDDPETVCARQEMRRLVEEALARLPTPYRVAVMLRDLEQLSGAEAAAAAGVPLATLKTRLLRGRLMMREILAARFERPAGGSAPGDRNV
jgi:RNA polymerase sigma-70 factor (ECF subfamily)